MREAIHFSYDGISSEQMGVCIASPSGGLYEETFLPTRKIVETETRGRVKRYFQGVALEPLSFPLTFFIEEWRDRDNLRQIAKWLFKDYYKPLVFETNYDRIFYALVEGDSKLFHNGVKDGYITLNFKCDSPYTYSHPINHKGIESRQPNEKFFTVYNHGDMAVKPKLWIKKKVSDGSISIKNNANDTTLTLSNLQLNEEVYLDCSNEDIISSLQYLNIYRIDDHNNVWLELVDDIENQLVLTGDFDLELEFEAIYLAD